MVSQSLSATIHRPITPSSRIIWSDTVILFPKAIHICTRHQPLVLLSCKCLFVQHVLLQAVALPVHEDDQAETNDQGKKEQYEVDGQGVRIKHLVGESIQGGLRKVEEAGKTDDEAVDLAECSKAKHLGRVVPGAFISSSSQVEEGSETYETVV